MLIPRNPYIDGNPVGNSDAFIGRDEILKKIINELEDYQQNAIVVYGQRRMGKTSVLQKLETILQAKNNFHPLFFDLQAKAQWSLEQVLEELARTISDVLKQSMPDFIDQDTKIIFSNWLNNLSQDRSLVLLFDEFDVLADPESKTKQEFFSYFKKLLSTNQKNLNAVFLIGRTINDLSNIVQVLFTKIPIVKIGLLDYNNTIKLIRLSETNQTLNWSNEAIETVWELTNGHPFLTQRLCSNIWEHFYNDDSDESPTVTSKDVNAAISETLSESSDYLEFLWFHLPPAEKIVISALASFETKLIAKSELEIFLNEREINIAIRKLHYAPNFLKDWELIQEDDNQNYYFLVKLLREWIVIYKPIDTVLENYHKNKQSKLITYLSK